MLNVPRFMESLLSIFRMYWDHEPGRDALPRVWLLLLPLPAKRGEGRGEGPDSIWTFEVRC